MDLDELEAMLRTIDDGQYWLEVDPFGVHDGVMLTAFSSVDGEPDFGTVLYRMPVLRLELGLAPGQTWPELWNLGRRMVPLPFPEDDYEARLGDALALRVLHVLTVACMDESRGLSSDNGARWRDPNPDVVPMWEALNDRTIMLNELRKMGRESL